METLVPNAPACTAILVKLAARCNLGCTYCYWFRDRSVYDAPVKLEQDAEIAFFAALVRHIQKHSLSDFSLILHGGEPLLFGKKRMRSFLKSIEDVEQITGATIKRSVMTNGVLLDDEWMGLFIQYQVQLGISVDGPPAVHDRYRIDLKGDGTSQRTYDSIELARKHGVDPGILAVCQPASDPNTLFDFFVNDLQVRAFDVLVPDATHDDSPVSIASYYKTLFDRWYEASSESADVEIRFFTSLLQGQLGGRSGSQVIGQGVITSVTLLTDGAIEALDTLRIAGDSSTVSRLNIRTHEIQDIVNDPLWREIYESSAQLPTICQQCDIVEACGGGHIASRWSSERRYDNPSVYCEDIKLIVDHAWERVSEDLYVELPNGETRPLKALTA